MVLNCSPEKLDGNYELVKDETRLDVIKDAIKLFWKELTRKRRIIYEHKDYRWDKVIITK